MRCVFVAHVMQQTLPTTIRSPLSLFGPGNPQKPLAAVDHHHGFDPNLRIDTVATRSPKQDRPLSEQPRPFENGYLG
jgi:hypothetical protein